MPVAEREPLSSTWLGPLLAGLGVIILDRLSKIIVDETMSLGQSLEVLGDFFRLTYIFNPGGIFGLRYGGSLFYLFLSLAAIAFMIYYYYISHHRHHRFRFPLALVIGGAIGNLVDRLWFGRVLDFLDFDIPDIRIPDFSIFFLRFPGFTLNRWPVFNLADSAITIGVLLIIFLLLFSPDRRTEAIKTSSDTSLAV